jgi:PHD/YefM family antitoxin component YafN of YafNO toxin-antitoxin module
MSTQALRMPITVAARKGVSAVAATAEERRVVLTNHGHPVAVVDSAERIDDALRRAREAARTVVEAAADAVIERGPAKLHLDDVCARLGISPDRVRARAHELAAE